MSKTQIGPWQMSDAPSLANALNNKKVQDNLRDGLPFPYTQQDAKDFITAMQNADKNSQYSFAILHDDVVIGSVGIFRKENIHKLTAEMGYYIAEPYWGKGIGTAAIKLACDFAFANTDILRIFAEPYAHNAPSCRVLEKAGFALEGIICKNAIKNGVVLDMKLYALLK